MTIELKKLRYNDKIIKEDSVNIKRQLDSQYYIIIKFKFKIK